MKVCLYSDVDVSDIHPVLGGGAKVSFEHQRKILEERGIEYTEDASEDHDILHINLLGPPALYQIFKASRDDDRKIVIHTHLTAENFKGSYTGSSLFAPIVDIYTKYAYSRADKLIAVSEYTEGVIKSKGIETDTTVISNGVDGEELDGFEEVELSIGGYEEENFNVVNLGAVFERKGVSEFIRCAEELPGSDFYWFGPKHRFFTPRKTKKRIRGSPDNVRFPGFVDDKREAFKMGDAFLFPSRSEEEGMAILEAAYCGLPLIVRDIPAYEGWLVDGENCLKAESEEEFLEHVKTLRDDPELRKRLGKNAREMAGERTLDMIGEKLEKVYQDVLDDG